VGVDLSPDALAFVRARRPSTTPVRASVEALPFADRTYDAVVALTLLYTVADDALALSELARVTRPGAPLFLVEPAVAALGRAHDTTVHGRRRYRRAELAELATSAGLTVRRCTYAYSFLTPPAAGLAAIDRLRRRRDEPAGSDVDKRSLDRAFAPLAERERRWLAHHDVPVGTSVVLLATR
jgi:ubiquinone/menaquinone biosynthesis C-methylase UbiE